MKDYAPRHHGASFQRNQWHHERRLDDRVQPPRPKRIWPLVAALAAAYLAVSHMAFEDEIRDTQARERPAAHVTIISRGPHPTAECRAWWGDAFARAHGLC